MADCKTPFLTIHQLLGYITTNPILSEFREPMYYIMFISDLKQNIEFVGKTAGLKSEDSYSVISDISFKQKNVHAYQSGRKYHLHKSISNAISDAAISIYPLMVNTTPYVISDLSIVLIRTDSSGNSNISSKNIAKLQNTPVTAYTLQNFLNHYVSDDNPLRYKAGKVKHDLVTLNFQDIVLCGPYHLTKTEPIFDNLVVSLQPGVHSRGFKSDTSAFTNRLPFLRVIIDVKSHNWLSMAGLAFDNTGAESAAIIDTNSRSIRSNMTRMSQHPFNPNESHRPISNNLLIEKVQQNSTLTIDVAALAGINLTGKLDDTAIINSAIAQVPFGDTVYLEFGNSEDTFQIDGTVVLPSNSYVIGNGATISSPSSLQTPGTSAQFINQNFNASPDTINSNISVQGLTFVYPTPLFDFGIWFQNVDHVAISGNIFLAAGNGYLALLNVSNSVVADNTGVGNINFAFNVWNGSKNVSFNNNSDYQTGSAAGSGGFALNGTYLTSNPLYPGGRYLGDQTSNFAVNNIAAGMTPGGVGFTFGSLGIGYTTNTGSNLQGNLVAENSTPSLFGFIDAGPGASNILQANIVSQAIAGNPEQNNDFYSSGGGTGLLSAYENASIGNEAFGSTGGSQVIQNVGDASTTSNDAVINGANLTEGTPLVGLENNGNIPPFVSGVGISIGFSSLNNGPVAHGLTIDGLDFLNLNSSSSNLMGLSVSSDPNLLNDSVTVELSAVFGDLSFGTMSGPTIVLNGPISQVDQELSTVIYVGNDALWNDNIHGFVTDSVGNTAVWNISVDFTQNHQLSGGIATFTPTMSTALYPGYTITNVPIPPPLGGDTLVVVGANLMANLSSSNPIILTGSNSDTVIGGPSPGYIQTNTGFQTIVLSSGGDVTVSGGVGGVFVNAKSGNDLIQSASGMIYAVLGSGTDTVLAGTDGASVSGGAGFAVITTLPQDSGSLNVTLGSGGGDVYALSGSSVLTTAINSLSTIYGGQGNLNVTSAGNDVILAGSGSTSVTATASGSDTVVAGSGSLYFQAGVSTSYILTGVGITTVAAGSGNLAIGGDGLFVLDIQNLSFASRTLIASGTGTVLVSGFNDPGSIRSEVASNGLLNVTLSDGTILVISDAVDALDQNTNGRLTANNWGVLGGTISDLGSSSSITISGDSSLTGQFNLASNQILDIAAGSALSIGPGSNLTGNGIIDVSGTIIGLDQPIIVGDLNLVGGHVGIDPATVTSNMITGTGDVTIGSHSEIDVSGTVGSGVTITYAGQSGTLGISSVSNLSGTINGFDSTDSVIFDATGSLTANFSSQTNGGGVLDVLSGTSQIGTIAFGEGIYSSGAFLLSALGNGSEQLSIACFVSGTLIRTAQGDREVETLVIGDQIITKDGRQTNIRWIGRKQLQAPIPEQNYPILFPRGCFGHGIPFEDTMISADHGVFVQDLLIPAGYLCNGVIRRVNPGRSISYFHIETDTHEIILAAGLPVETFIDIQSRNGFDNAEEYRTLYDNDIRRPITESFPRTLAGEVASAAILSGLGPHFFENLPKICHQACRGCVDEVTDTFVRGWACINDTVTVVEVLVNGRIKGYSIASDYRKDLFDAGIANGLAGFTFHFARPLSDDILHIISVRIISNTAELEGSPARREIQKKSTLLIDQTFTTSALLQSFLTNTRSRQLSFVNAKPVALVIDAEEPDPDRDAGSEAILSHVMALSNIGYRVIFVSNLGICSENAVAAIESVGAEAVQLGGAVAIESILNVINVDIAFIHRPSVTLAFAGMIRAKCPECKIIMSIADLEHIRLDTLYKLTGNVQYQLSSDIAQSTLNLAIGVVHHVITHSITEKYWIQKNYPFINVDNLLWSPKTQHINSCFDDRAGFAFIGGMRHAPNLDAAFWIDRVIEPKLRERRANFDLNLIGSNFPDLFNFIDRVGLRCVGHVKNLSETMASLRGTIAPLRAGAGVKGKVLTSLISGTPCIMSSIAADGLELPTELRGLISDDPDNMVTLMIKLHKDSGFWRAVSDASIEWSRDTLSPEKIQLEIEKILFRPVENQNSDQRVRHPSPQLPPPIVGLSSDAAYAVCADVCTNGIDC